MERSSLSDEERAELNRISRDIIDSAIKIHTVLGPGLLESAYEACLEHELRRRKHKVLRQVILPVVFEGMNVDLGYRIDLIIDDRVLVELKACEALHPIHKAQLTSYLRLSGRHLGLLINFHVPRLKDGIVRQVNSF
jgi:GxxExxY protein